VVTSPTGAVVQDILRVLGARYASLEVLIYPARVQGEGAAQEIVQGIRALSGVRGLDALIVARGGGSLEDLWPFNEEVVARALAASEVVTISAVGHETDYTIADFVADLRAPTPTAAAELVVQARDELRARVLAVTSHRVFAAERGRIHNHAQRVDGLAHRAQRGALQQLERARAGLRRGAERLDGFRFERQLADRRARVARSRDRLESRLRADFAARRGALLRLVGVLDSLSPLGVLARGYALVWDAAGQKLLRRSDDVKLGDALRVRLLEGGLRATVTSKE
jgi:exodeoxyribonuclease VII large subunit